MGRVKEIYMDIIQEDYKGSHDAYIQELSKQSCEEFIYDENILCPNCFNTTLHRNELEAICDTCGQDFIYVGSALRFK